MHALPPVRFHIIAALLGLLAALPAASEEAAVETPAAEAPAIPETLASPRATLTTFLDAMAAVRDGDTAAIEEAIATLDLAGINPLVRAEKGRDAVWILQEVIDRTRIPNVNRIPSRESGKPFVFHSYDSGSIEIAFVDGAGWKFTADTIAALPAMLDETADRDRVDGAAQGSASSLPVHLRLRAMIPPSWKEQQFILEQWQWLAILLIILIGVVADKLVSVVLAIAVRVWRARFATGAFRTIADDILRPFGLMAMALVWWAGLSALGLPGEVLLILLVSVKFLACLSAVWGAYRLVDLLAAFLNEAATKTDSKLDDALIPLLTKTMKVFVTVMGVVFIADNLDIDVTSLLAGLGLGGLAFALAAKDVAGNLFGSITVLLDQTFHVGDWVIIGDVEGSVEHIGFRSTRIRTFYNSLVSVPNATLITSAVDNMGERRYRRLSCKLSITYDTPPERIDAFCAGIRELILQHPYTRKDYFHVYLNGLGAASLEILLYVFWQTPDWSTELRERHRLLLDCLRLAKRLGVEFAFPTQTLYMKRAAEGLLAPEDGEFTVRTTAQGAHELGAREARTLVDATLGLGVVPPPVGAMGPGSGDSGA